MHEDCRCRISPCMVFTDMVTLAPWMGPIRKNGGAFAAAVLPGRVAHPTLSRVAALAEVSRLRWLGYGVERLHLLHDDVHGVVAARDDADGDQEGCLELPAQPGVGLGPHHHGDVAELILQRYEDRLGQRRSS